MANLIVLPKPYITERDLTMLAADYRVEVVRGELSEVDMSAAGLEHMFITNNVYDLIKPYVDAHRLGFVHTNGLTYILQKEGDRVQITRIPDFGFIRRNRIRQSVDLARPFNGYPDLAIEIITREETTMQILAKVQDYLVAGTDEVWVLFPSRQELHQYRRDNPTIRVYGGSDAIETDRIFPGMKLIVQNLFTFPNFDTSPR
jgi:Uma2 family endonuclease